MSVRAATFRPLLGAFAFVLAGAVFSPPTRLSAQKTLCLNGSPAPECSSFLILELGGVLSVVQTSRSVQYSGGDSQRLPEQAFDDRLQWELGMMRNVGPRWALGGAARLGPGSDGALTGLTARGRRWLNSDLSVDLSAGATFQANGHGGRRAGPIADVRLNLRDDLYAGVRYESMNLPHLHEEVPQYGVFDDPGGRQHALSLLLGMGSEWAMGGTAAIGLALALFLATADFT